MASRLRSWTPDLEAPSDSQHDDDQYDEQYDDEYGNEYGDEHSDEHSGLDASVDGYSSHNPAPTDQLGSAAFYIEEKADWDGIDSDGSEFDDEDDPESGSEGYITVNQYLAVLRKKVIANVMDDQGLTETSTKTHKRVRVHTLAHSRPLAHSYSHSHIIVPDRDSSTQMDASAHTHMLRRILSCASMRAHTRTNTHASAHSL